MRTLILALLSSSVIAACGGGDGGGGSGTANKPAPFTCAIDALSGTWRTHYEETNGTCGPVADETAIFGTNAPSGCTMKTRQISSDRCRADLAFECPTTDQRGTQDWVLTLTQVSDTMLRGTGTVQLNHPAGTCRSTYDLTVTKL